jgi:hypothetical protein
MFYDVVHAHCVNVKNISRFSICLHIYLDYCLVHLIYSSELMFEPGNHLDAGHGKRTIAEA